MQDNLPEGFQEEDERDFEAEDRKAENEANADYGMDDFEPETI